MIFRTRTSSSKSVEGYLLETATPENKERRSSGHLWTFSSPEGSQQSTLAISPMMRKDSPLPHSTQRLAPQDSMRRTSFDESNSERSSLESLRLWRHDALLQHQLDTGAFIGEIVLKMTNDPNDAFWLSQVYFGLGHYARAYNTLKKSSMFEKSIACHYLAGRCLIKLYMWKEALELLGNYDFSIDGIQNKNEETDDGGIKLIASICYLRGVVLFNMNSFDAAKKAFKDALKLDVKCFEAFEQLISNNLISSEEEKNMLEDLNFSCMAPKLAEMIKLLYSIKMNKLKNFKAITAAKDKLKDEYGLNGCLNLEKCTADILFAQCKFRECLKVTNQILEADPYKFSCFPVHVSCLYELNRRNDLFLFSNKIAEKHANEPSSWLAVGTYYLCIGKVSEARRYFSKASSIDPKFGPAWIGFAHSFAIEGEHDQAISAYTTAARLFQGSHLPNLFLGMQHLQLTNLTLADEYLQVAYKLCDCDPLLLNEMGAVAYQKGDISKAIEYFIKALEIVKFDECDIRAWASTWTNLGHAYRKIRDFETALYAFEQSLLLAPQDSNTHSAAALVYMFLGDRSEAIHHLHTCLSIAPNDSVATDLLRRALEESALKDPLEKIFDILPDISERPLNQNILDDQALLAKIIKTANSKKKSQDVDDMEMISSSE